MVTFHALIAKGIHVGEPFAISWVIVCAPLLYVKLIVLVFALNCIATAWVRTTGLVRFAAFGENWIPMEGESDVTGYFQVEHNMWGGQKARSAL